MTTNNIAISYGEIADAMPGIYDARELNPPGGDDSTHVEITEDAYGKWARWCYENGESIWEWITVEEFDEED